MKETGTVERKRGNGRPSKITRKVAVVVGQYMRRDTAISTRQLAIKVQETQGEMISHQTIWRHMKRKEYENSIPRGTPMLENRHIEAQKKWAEEHKNDNWNRTIFTDETAFDLFRNKVRRWHKRGKRPSQRLPKPRQKVLTWGGISLKGKTPLFCFTEIIDGPFYVTILQNHLLTAAQNIYNKNLRLQQDNDPKHTSKVAQEFIDRNRIKVVDWPANSSDLNPIENV